MGYGVEWRRSRVCEEASLDAFNKWWQLINQNTLFLLLTFFFLPFFPTIVSTVPPPLSSENTADCTSEEEETEVRSCCFDIDRHLATYRINQSYFILVSLLFTRIFIKTKCFSVTDLLQRDCYFGCIHIFFHFLCSCACGIPSPFYQYDSCFW